MSELAALAIRIQSSLEDVETSVERIALLIKKALQTGDDGFWDGVALNLHSFYTGIEHIFEDIARSIDGELPSSAEWHIDLLNRMSNEVSGIRPAVISNETRQCMDAYRGLRHVIRNVYAFNLQPDRLQELGNELPGCFKLVRQDLEAFAEFLKTIEQLQLLNKLDVRDEKRKGGFICVESPKPLNTTRITKLHSNQVPSKIPVYETCNVKYKA